jgi:N-acetylglucosamine kinase-like BadF-type ATPase
MRDVYLAFDGGGTKLAAAALSAHGETLAVTAVKGGVNKKTASETQIRATVRSAIETLRQSAGEFRVLHSAGFFMHNDGIIEELTGSGVTELDEGLLGLLAAGIEGDGVVIISGTGADAYFVRDGKTVEIIGGYGAFLGDGGSGFAIGRDAINAAARSYEGRGEKTLLEDMLREKYPAESFRKSLYGIYSTEYTVGSIANFCIECEKAADKGDKIAVGIFQDAAKELYSYAAAGYKKLGFEKSTPYTFAGGVIMHDISRDKPLMEPYIVKALSADGITNYVKPAGQPISGAVKWIRKNLCK